MMLTFKEGHVTILYVPFDTELTETDRTHIHDILFRYNFPQPSWDEYCEILEGYIIEDDMEEREVMEGNEDDHIDAYFVDTNIHHEITNDIRQVTGLSDVMVCSGKAGYCSTPL